MKYILLWILCLFFLFCGCGKKDSKNDDTATYGEIAISADEAFQPIVQAEIDVFEALYKYAKVNTNYKSESEAFKDLIEDSVRLIFATRELNKEEAAYFEKIKIFPRVNKIAMDGVALIVNQSNKDTLITMNQLKGLFSGKISKWNEFNKKNINKEINIVFDNNNSSNFRFIKEKFALDSGVSKHVFSANSNKGVVDYVKSNPDAIGVIGVNWISDGDDSTTKSFLSSIKVVSIASIDNPGSLDDYYKPYQAYIAKDLYPLKRDLFIISREARVGLGTGFSAFVASDRGQRIILKSGLVPATVPLRIVDMKNKPL